MKSIPLLLILLAANVQAEDAEALFARRIAPLFQDKCLACHGNDAKKIKGDFDMRSRETVLKGGESEQPGLVPGKPEQSPLFLAATRQHEADWEPMPPKEADKLSAAQIEWIKQWIAGGAPWPDKVKIDAITKSNADKWSAEDGIVVKTVGAQSDAWATRKYKPEGLWAYQPVRKPDSKSIDDLIALHLPDGIKPAPAADARTFIRRATFDLTGLPPTPEDVEAFVQSSLKDSDTSIKALIDRLLDSPHYGERMAQHWLDVTRYADSSGFANDFERGNAWRYRDYVIRAFNNDKPYDQFIKEQIAGDEIDPSNPEKLIATGFLRMGPWELTGMEVAKVARQRFLDDATNAVGETFLAQSLQCARCHDHKFDPVPTHDYYSIQAVFGTTQLSERDAPFLPHENTQGFDEKKYLDLRRQEHQAKLMELDAALLKNAEAWFAEKKIDRAPWDRAVRNARDFITSGGKGKKGRSFVGVFEVARGAMEKQGIAEDQYPPKLVGFTPEQYGNERVARKGLERLKWELDRYEPYALSVYSGRTVEVKAVLAPTRMAPDRMTNGELEETCVLPGGDPFGKGPKVEPGTLSVLTAFNPATQIELPATSIEGRRKAFADWVASKDNPLTTRAIVNRVWMWHFGQPLAGNPNNFGSTGKKPTHPELLDWLAATFVEKGWSFKELHRAIMMSEAYRRSASLDRSADTPVRNERASASTESGDVRAGKSARAPLPREELEKCYAVFPPRRLTAEELRDSMLAVSGELNPTLGGIPIRPEINLEAALQPRQVMGTFASAWTPNPLPAQRNRRSIYALKLRGLTDPMQEVFNSPAPDFSCERRDASTVTPQVFSLFNSKASAARALALAARVMKETRDDTHALQRCFALVYGRTPSADETTTCRAHWQAMEAEQAKLTFPAEQPPLEVRRDAVEENTGEKFSFREKLHANADFVPDLQPSAVDPHTRALADLCLALLNSNEFAYVY